MVFNHVLLLILFIYMLLLDHVSFAFNLFVVHICAVCWLYDCMIGLVKVFH